MNIEEFLAVLVAMISIVTALPKRREVQRLDPTSFDHFDDYLLSVAAPRAYNQILKEEPRTTTETTPTHSPEEVASVDILGYFKDVPRQHWSCCMLGKLAGDKGFHCLADYYATRITGRNFNRAHTRHMPFHTEESLDASSRATMRTFQRCVARHAEEFNKCCYTATIEREEMDRWEMFRRLAASERIRIEES